MSSPMTTHQLIAAKGILPRGNALISAAVKKRHERDAAQRRAHLSRLIGEGAGREEIADVFGITEKALRTWAERHRADLPPPGHGRPYERKKPPVNATAAPTPSANAMRAQAAMFRLLEAHFDADKGRYADGWNDARIAKEVGLAPLMVQEFRRAGFGELSANPEVDALRLNLAALKKLVDDEVASLESRMRRIEAQK